VKRYSVHVSRVTTLAFRLAEDRLNSTLVSECFPRLLDMIPLGETTVEVPLVLTTAEGLSVGATEIDGVPSWGFARPPARTEQARSDAPPPPTAAS
jgi:hypothetical protein